MSKNKVGIWNEFRDIQRERMSEYLAHSIDLDTSVTMQFCELSAALGCYQPKPEYFMQAFKCKPKEAVYGIYHFRNRFFQLPSASDLLQCRLQQVRYRIFAHLYRRLFELEKDNGKRQLYLTFCYKLFDLDKPYVLSIQKNLILCEQFLDRLAGLTKMMASYCKADLESSNLKKDACSSTRNLHYFPIKIMKYALRESYGYHNCYVSGLRWQQEFILITDLTEQYIEHESVDYEIFVENQVLLSWHHNGDDICLFHGAMPQQYKEYLRSYSQLMQNETNNADIYYQDSSSTVADIPAGNLWESREMILFLTDIIEQICRDYEIKEIAVENSQLVACQGHQTESRRAQYVDHVVQTCEKYMWESWLDELFDEEGERIVIEELSNDKVSSSSTTLVFLPQLEMIPEPEKEVLLEAELKTEAIVFEPDSGPILKPELDNNLVLKEQENERKESLVTSMQPQSKPTLEVKPELVPIAQLGLEHQQILVQQLDRNLEPVLVAELLPEQNILEPLAMWELQRHIIVAPRVIIQSFKCNPSYQPSPRESDGSDFYEQLAQFIETMSLHDIINIESIRERLAAVIRWNIGKLCQSSENCIRAMATFQLDQLLTGQELETYKVMSWYHRDRGDNNNMTPQERRQDALHAMMGYECQQLMPSARYLRLVLRSPHYQESISESYLLLSLSQVGYYYRSLQLLRHKLTQLGEQGEALVPCVIKEIIVLHEFYKQQQQTKSTASLFHLFARTRSIQVHFQWLLHLCEALTSQNSRLLWTLHCQIGSSGAACDLLLQKWLLSATKPLLVRLGKWLLAGHLPQSEEHEQFFIAEREEIIDDFWSEKFRVIVDRLPPFVSRKLAQLMLCIGRSRRYAQQFLGIQLTCSLTAEQLQVQLSAACAEIYQGVNQQLLELIIMGLQRETSSLLLEQLQLLRPVPIELLTKLHQYLLLSDTDFAWELIELLLPLLEQPVCCYNAQQLNDIMGQLLGCHNSQLYVDQSDAGGATHCWSCFLLCWKLPVHWRAMLERSLPQYAASFGSLWQLHYVHYVLTERVQRQQSHFPEQTIGISQLGDAREVRFRFEQFIDKLRGFIQTLRNYVLKDVLGSAFEGLYTACKKANTVDELLDWHSEYLHEIAVGIFQTKPARKSRFYLEKLYYIVLQLDAEHTKFLALYQVMVKYICGVQSLEGATKRLQEFCWSCQSTCDVLDDLDKQFQSALVNFLLSLYCMGGKHWETLAKKLDGDRFYANNFEQLKVVQTFWFQRKQKKQI